jgi:hypothetical protein
MEAPPAFADDVRWSLDDLHTSPDDARDSLSEAASDAQAVAETYRGTIADLDAETLADALDAVADIQDRVGRA